MLSDNFPSFPTVSVRKTSPSFSFGSDGAKLDASFSQPLHGTGS
ncbi:hypothetical protein LptCag_2029 [Leptospirillum ferriphilum]|uniref:Uncharacterized protein n=1 Tax=Leptospirillum ferriphilum TaxID=178606 RepID=A0A094X7W0_9BACT|nr:hypothetical protein LptCag_2029 [Leptospirillum ferriphilum]